jgi:hypothetical protein
MTTVIVPLLTYCTKKINALRSIIRFGKDRNLSFSDKDELPGAVIALDARKRKLLFFRKSTYRQSCMIIDLQHVNSCSIVRKYENIDAGALRVNKLASYLKSISLCLRFTNNPGMVTIPFFESHYNRKDDIDHLDRKAGQWSRLVSKQPLLLDNSKLIR